MTLEIKRYPNVKESTLHLLIQMIGGQDQN